MATNLLALIGVLFIGVVALVSCKEESDWRQFIVDHQCRVVSKMSGSYGYSTSGNMVYVEGKTGWACNDGMTYWR